MTVQFEDSPQLYDQLLGPVLRSARGSLEAIACALLMKGLTNDLAKPGIRLWIRINGKGVVVSDSAVASRSQHGSDAEGGLSESGPVAERAHSLSDLVQRNGVWQRLCVAVEEEVLRSTSLSRREIHLDVATKLYAGLLLPLPTAEKVMMARNVNARVTLAVTGLKILDAPELITKQGARATPMRTSLSIPNLAATLGWGLSTAQRTLTHLEEMSLLRHPQGSSFIPGKYAIAQKDLTKQRRSQLVRFEESIEALVDGERDPIADVLRTVTHPIWSYSGVFNQTHWLALLLDTADIPVSTFRMLSTKEREMRKLLNAEYLTPAHVALLRENLDRLADDPEFGVTEKVTGEKLTAKEAHGRAMVKREAERAVNKENATQAREAKQLAYEGLSALLAANPIPPSPAGGRRSTREQRQKDFRAWIKAMQSEVLAMQPDENFRTRAGVTLEKKMLKQGYQASAPRAVKYIMRAPAGARMVDYLRGDDADLVTDAMAS